MSESPSTILMRLSKLDRMLATTEDPVELKKGSDVIEVIRGLAKRSHLSLEIVNDAFFERVKWDRKRGQWIKENIEKGGDRKSKLPDVTLNDIDTEKRESVYCQKLIDISDEKVLHYISLCLSQKSPAEAGKTGLIRNATDGTGEYQEPELPVGTFEVIYADPGWQYDNFNVQNAAQALYTTWPVEEICEKWADPVTKVTSNQSVLFLWATNPMLLEALQVMAAWGFKYKTNLAWVKPSPLGKAWWARSQHELLLIGVRSNTTKPVWVPSSCLMCDRGEHSQKPEEFRTTIETMYPAGSWLELFAREHHDGWESYGDELK